MKPREIWIFNIIFLFIFTVVTTAINIFDFMEGGKSDTVNVMASILFILAWVFASFLGGTTKKWGFLVVLSIYFGVSGALAALTYFLHLMGSMILYLTMIIPSFATVIPLFGIENYFKVNFLIAAYITLAVYVLCLISFMTGRFIGIRSKGDAL